MTRRQRERGNTIEHDQWGRPIRYFVQERNEDGRLVKVMYGVRLLSEEEMAQYPLPEGCRNWVEYVRSQVRLMPWMCGHCLCPSPRVGADNVLGVLVRERDFQDSRTFATHLCRSCFDALRASGEYYLTNAYLVPTGLPICWHPEQGRRNSQ